MDSQPSAPPVVTVVVASEQGDWFEEALAAVGAQDYPNQYSGPSVSVDDPEHGRRRQSDQQLAHARRVNFHRGSPELDGLDTIKFAEPLYRVRDARDPAQIRRAANGLLSLAPASGRDLPTH